MSKEKSKPACPFEELEVVGVGYGQKKKSDGERVLTVLVKDKSSNLNRLKLARLFGSAELDVVEVGELVVLDEPAQVTSKKT